MFESGCEHYFVLLIQKMISFFLEKRTFGVLLGHKQQEIIILNGTVGTGFNSKMQISIHYLLLPEVGISDWVRISNFAGSYNILQL